MVKRSLKCAPVELVKDYNPLNPSNKKLELLPKGKFHKVKNKRRVNWTYKINDLICVKNIKRKKHEMVWLGPYLVIDVSTDLQRVIIKEYEREQWYNIKNVKPFWKREDVVLKEQHLSGLN